MSAKRPVLLVNLGTAAAPTPEAVREFLHEFLSDPLVVDYPAWLWRPILRRILRSRPAKVAELYRSIWHDEGSPLDRGTRRIAASLAEATGREVAVAYRYGAPSLRGALERVPRGTLVVPLFPQRTSSTTGTIERVVEEVAPERSSVLRIPPDDPGYVAAQAELVAEKASDGPPEHLVVSFHGIPVRYDRSERGLYRRDCQATFEALLKRMSWPETRATLSFQSRFGPEPWLRPATAAVLERLGRRGVRSVAVATPGFLTEGLETAEEIGIRGRETFLEAGGTSFTRIPVVEAHPAFVESLVRLVSREER